MRSELFINNKDAWETWGVRMGSGFLETIDSFNQMKDFVQNESRIEDGVEVIVEDEPKVSSRELTLSFTITGSTVDDYKSKKKAFQQELEKAKVEISVPILGTQVYKLIYTGKGISYALSLSRKFSKFSAKFLEPNPRNRD